MNSAPESGQLTSENLHGLEIKAFLDLIDQHADQESGNEWGKWIGAYLKMSNTPNELGAISLGEAVARMYEKAIDFYMRSEKMVQFQTSEWVGQVLNITWTGQQTVDFADFDTFMDGDETTWGSFRTISNCGELELRNNFGLAILRSAWEEALRRSERWADDFSSVSFSGYPTLAHIQRELRRNPNRNYVNTSTGRTETFTTLDKKVSGSLDAIKREMLDCLGRVSKKDLKREDYISYLSSQARNTWTWLNLVMSELPESLDRISDFHETIIKAMYIELLTSGKFVENVGVIDGSVTIRLESDEETES